MFDAPYVLLDDTIAKEARLFQNPVELFLAESPSEAIAAFDGAQQALDRGYHVAGYASYELGYALEEKLRALTPAAAGLPYLVMAAFPPPRRVIIPAANKSISISAQPRWDRDTYATAFSAVQRYIAAGDTYQINLTFPIDIELSGSPWDLYLDRRTRQPTCFGGVVDIAGPKVISFSPELFFRIDGGLIRARPMKGTAPRGNTPDEDAQIAAMLSRDIKQRAENLMIVDLLRNDIGRISETGSVRVPDLFTVETYPTLHTMVSGIEGRLKPGLSMLDVFAALFPCGSVTGAPKVRAMEIIAELEPWQRGAYCGAVGVFSPDGSALFNVAIRTLTVLDTTRAIYSVGGGLVADSIAEAEYDECLLKAKFLLG